MLPKFIQTLLFKTLFETIETDKEVTVYPMIKGWIDILIYKQTPREDSFQEATHIKTTYNDV